MHFALPSLLAAAVVGSASASAALARALPGQTPLTVPSLAEQEKVNVSLFVMSRCPDARLCESVFEDVVQTSGIADKINLNMHYIGVVNSSAPYGVSSKHGDLESAGDAHQLCLAAHLPLEDFYAALSCMNYGKFPGDIGQLSLVRKCAETVGRSRLGRRSAGEGGDGDGDGSEDGDTWETSAVGRCVEGHKKNTTSGVDEDGGEDEDDGLDKLGKEARKLLVENVAETKRLNVTTSCTIQIDSTLVHGNKRVCVVDGGVWTGCDDGHAATDFVRVIEAEWKNLQTVDW